MMKKKPDDDQTISPDSRQAQVLTEIIRRHLAHGEPVGSATISRSSGTGLSAASIRNIMAELSDRGLLSQPHTSAGRVPTDRALRLYVDQILPAAGSVEAAEAESIAQALEPNRGELAELLAAASRQLSLLSHQASLIVGPELGRIVVDHLEFVRLDDSRVMVVLVGRTGVVHNRVLEVEPASEPLEQNELERIGRFLSERHGGRTLPRMLERLRAEVSEERAAADRLQAQSLMLCRKAAEAELEEGELFVEGISNLLASPELAETDVIRGLFQTLEEKQTVIDLLTRLLDDDGVRVVIGEENPLADQTSALSSCSIVVSGYGSGTVAIVGPKRMPYGRVIPLVDHLARALTGLISPSRKRGR